MASVSSSNQTPSRNPTTELKSKLLRPALTSHYAVYINPATIQSKTDAGSFFANRQANIDGELLTLSCSEASLPGSSLATHEINNDFTGVTERHVYRRQYDDRIDFTFYVDHDYKVIKFFETWMSWIVGEDQFQNQSNNNFSYRVKFPEDYKTNIYIQKFEKDFTSAVEYAFIGAYPISITSMPVSYDSSQLLKCTVSMSYIRYFMNNSVALSQFGVDNTGQFGQTGSDLNKNPFNSPIPGFELGQRILGDISFENAFRQTPTQPTQGPIRIPVIPASTNNTQPLF